MNADGTQGYFTSNREGGFGEDDIYYFDAPDGIEGVDAPKPLDSRILVFDAVTKEPISLAAIRIFERAADGFIEGDDLYDLQLLPSEDNNGELTMKLIRKRNEDLGEPNLKTNTDGEAITQLKTERRYIILASKEGYVSNEVSISTIDETEPQVIRIELDPSKCITLTGVALDSRVNTRIPNALVQITSSCDGSQESVRTNVQGEFEFCLAIGCQYTVTGNKEGYADGTTSVSTEKIRGLRSLTAELLMTPFTNEIVSEPLRAGTIIVLENIYYDFGKSAIRAGAARELDALIELMRQYPSMKIEMAAHTDSRGSSRYNQDLSVRRAVSAKNYLVNRGISSDRITTVGYGESRPRNRCSDGVQCTEEEHQCNRRTEVKITSINEGVDVQYRDDGPEVIDRKRN